MTLYQAFIIDHYIQSNQIKENIYETICRFEKVMYSLVENIMKYFHSFLMQAAFVTSNFYDVTCLMILNYFTTQEFINKIETSFWCGVFT